MIRSAEVENRICVRHTELLSFSISCVNGNTTVSHSAVKVFNTSESRKKKKKMIKAFWLFFFSEKHPIFNYCEIEASTQRRRVVKLAKEGR